MASEMMLYDSEEKFILVRGRFLNVYAWNPSVMSNPSSQFVSSKLLRAALSDREAIIWENSLEDTWARDLNNAYHHPICGGSSWVTWGQVDDFFAHGDMNATRNP